MHCCWLVHLPLIFVSEPVGLQQRLQFFNSMSSLPCLFRRLCCLVALVCCTAAAGWPAWAAAALLPGAAPSPSPAPVKLRIVGGLASVSQFTRLEEPFWAQELARLSQGRFSAEIVAFNRVAIPGVKMVQLLQLGVVPFGTMLMGQIAAQYPQYAAPDLAGLTPDLASLRVTLSAFRPYLEKSLREQHGIEALAIYIYPAQVIFCKRAFTGLADLVGRHIRVSSNSQADFVGALGAVPMRIDFVQMVQNLEVGSLDCAITGAASGNTLGLHTLTSHLHAMPLGWGLAIFGANSAAWNALPAELKDLLRRELPRLEERLWQSAERETAMGTSCNIGAPACMGGSRGRMVLVPISAQDERLRNEIFRTTVLPRWLLRCGDGCEPLWRDTIGSARGIALPAAP